MTLSYRGPNAVPKFFGLTRNKASSGPRGSSVMPWYSVSQVLTYHSVTIETVFVLLSIRSSNCCHLVSRNLNQFLSYLIITSEKNTFQEGPESSSF